MTLLKKYPLLNNVWFIAGTLLFAADRFCKFWSQRGHMYFRDAAVSFWEFKNKGIAFSIPLAAEIFWPAAAVIFVILAVLFAKSFRKDVMRAGLYWMVLLGALSNLIDRATIGATADYLIFFNRSAVNIADGMIVLGLLLLSFGKTGSAITPSVAAKTES